MYNITVAGTHTYLVGQDGLVVHNTCGNLDNLAKKFLNEISPSIKRSEIAVWWAKGWPVSGDYLNSLFGRGMFFEKLMKESSLLKGYTSTAKNHQDYDFYRLINGVQHCVSMKTTKFTNVQSWLNYIDKNGNKKMLTHLEDINKKVKRTHQDVSVGGPGSKIKMIIVMPESNNFEATKLSWLTTLRTKFTNVEFEITTIEKQFNL